MPKCPGSIEELQELERLLPLCKRELYEQAQARIASGEASSQREAARQLGEELGRSPNTIRQALKRAQEKRVGTVSPVMQDSEYDKEPDHRFIPKPGHAIIIESLSYNYQETVLIEPSAFEGFFFITYVGGGSHKGRVQKLSSGRRYIDGNGIMETAKKPVRADAIQRIVENHLPCRLPLGTEKWLEFPVDGPALSYNHWLYNSDDDYQEEEKKDQARQRRFERGAAA